MLIDLINFENLKHKVLLFTVYCKKMCRKGGAHPRGCM